MTGRGMTGRRMKDRRTNARRTNARPTNACPTKDRWLAVAKRQEAADQQVLGKAAEMAAGSGFRQWRRARLRSQPEPSQAGRAKQEAAPRRRMVDPLMAGPWAAKKGAAQKIAVPPAHPVAQVHKAGATARQTAAMEDTLGRRST